MSYMGIHVPQWIPCCHDKIVYTVNKVACMKHHFCTYSSCSHLLSYKNIISNPLLRLLPTCYHRNIISNPLLHAEHYLRLLPLLLAFNCSFSCLLVGWRNVVQQILHLSHCWHKYSKKTLKKM